MNTGEEIVVGMADMKIGRDGQVLTTILGSCVGVCLYAPEHKVGGLLHVMMPAAGNKSAAADFKKAKYADTGVPELIRLICASYGIRSSDLEAKIFGGASMFLAFSSIRRDISMENIEGVKTALKFHKIPLKAVCVGGQKGSRIKFDLETGKIIYQTFGDLPQEV